MLSPNFSRSSLTVSQPGSNEITVVGLTPTVDEHSIKVEGTGSNAIISDITVLSLPNREIFQDIYPDSDSEEEDGEDDEADKDEDEEDGDDEARKVAAKLDTVRRSLTVLRDNQQRAKEVIASAATCLKLLDAYGGTLHQKNRGVTIDNGLETYRLERERVFADHMKERSMSGSLPRRLPSSGRRRPS